MVVVHVSLGDCKDCKDCKSCKSCKFNGFINSWGNSVVEYQIEALRVGGSNPLPSS